MRSAFRVAVLLLVLVSSPALAQRGTLFVVGGGTQPAALVEEFVRVAGGPDARIVVIAMASAAGARSGEAKAADLRALGARATNLWFSRAAADSDSVVRLLDSATGVWFGGGDQNRLLGVLRGTRVERAIRTRWEQGAVVGGTSAGAAILSTPMITGDETGERRDTTEAWTRIAAGTVAVDSGLAFITNAVIDQHFVRRKRSNRLLSLVLATPPHLGAGIDEGTALIVEPDGSWRIMGASVVIVYDARGAIRRADGSRLAASGVTMHVLGDGARFDPATGRAVLR